MAIFFDHVSLGKSFTEFFLKNLKQHNLSLIRTLVFGVIYIAEIIDPLRTSVFTETVQRKDLLNLS